MGLQKVSNKKVVEENKGIVYILVLEIDGKTISKIGLTARKIEDRVCEILTSYFKSYRIFPQCYPKRFSSTNHILVKEQMLLEWFKEYKYTSERKFSGCQELVEVDLDVLVDTHSRVLAGEVLVMEDYEKCKVCKKDKKFLVNEQLSCGHKCEVEDAEETNDTD